MPQTSLSAFEDSKISSSLSGDSPDPLLTLCSRISNRFELPVPSEGSDPFSAQIPVGTQISFLSVAVFFSSVCNYCLTLA